MRTLTHPWDWIGHAVFFCLMAAVMAPLWAVILCAILLEVDQWWTWHKKGWCWFDCCIDLLFDSIGIGFVLWLRLVL